MLRQSSLSTDKARSACRPTKSNVLLTICNASLLEVIGVWRYNYIERSVTENARGGLMTKKAIIGVVIAVAIIALVAVLIWGLQPVQQQQVTYEQLLKKDGKLDGKIVPNNLPFDGVVEYCAITYPQGHDGMVPLRFELSDERATGYILVVVGEN